jgi:cyclic pyranopterin phosphate synthase
MLIDPFGRAITYLRISITDKCNLRCVYCQPEEGIQWIRDEELLSADEIVHVTESAISLGIKKVRLTGGEPLTRKDILEIVSGISRIPGLEDLSLTTNALLLDKLAGPLVKAGLQRVNISLDTLKPEKYRKITRLGDFQKAWQGILEAERAGLKPIKLNTVVVGGLNDDEIVSIASLSIEHPWHIRFIELMPVANEQDWGNGLPPNGRRYFSVQKMHEALAGLNLEFIETPTSRGPERTYRIPDARGTVGFIAPLGDHFCNRCNRLRLTADGRLRSCLLVDKEISIREVLHSDEGLKSFLIKAVTEKPAGHALASHNCPDSRCMAQIGG